MTPRQAERYFMRTAKYQESDGVRIPYYYVRTPNGKFLSHTDIEELRRKFDAAIAKGA